MRNEEQTRATKHGNSNLFGISVIRSYSEGPCFTFWAT